MTGLIGGFRLSNPRVAATGLLVAAGVLALYAAPSAFAADPAHGAYTESGMLDAARGAANGADKTVDIGLPPPDEMRVLEARREAELKLLSEKLKRAEARAPAAHATTGPIADVKPWTTDVAAAPDQWDDSQRSALGAHPDDHRYDAATASVRGKATILMVMAPRGGRAYDMAATADPILCMEDGCYVSNGPQAPATYHLLHESTSFAGRIGRGAGACNGALACVFRDVDVGRDTAMVQPIDLRHVHHDRREQAEVAIDNSCRMIDGALSCSRPVRTESYSLWIVPEGLARDVGPEIISKALAEGLRTARTAALPWAGK